MSILSASVAKETTEATRARAYSIFYMMVTIGAFTGKTIIDPLRNVIGEQAYIYINSFSGAMTIIALLAVILLYKSTHTAGEGKSLREISRGFMKIITNWRLLILILIVTGFWMVQQQLYATMPKYVIRMAGETAKPGWIANVNPFVVVCFVSFITRLMAKRSAITSMNVGMFLIPFSALLMACGNLLGNDIISGMSNITLMMVFGIVVQALAECFISPRYLEYFSLQAPKGEEGMYLGFSHLHSFLSSIFGFGIAGVLLTKYCPDPVLFETREAWEAASVNAHYIWYYFAVIGLVAAIALFVFAKTTEFIDKKQKKYDSGISQGGSNVSGGQKQRLSIARAVYRHPEILIFDDSFPALDFKTDRAVRDALEKEAKDSTKLIVAQRIGTIMNADRIIVLDDGKVVGQGTHEELLDTCEVYRQIAESQLSEDELKR